MSLLTYVVRLRFDGLTVRRLQVRAPSPGLALVDAIGRLPPESRDQVTGAQIVSVPHPSPPGGTDASEG